MILFLVFYAVGYVIRFLRKFWAWVDYIAYMALLAIPALIGYENDFAFDVLFSSILFFTIPLYYIFDFDRKVKYHHRDGSTSTIKCKHCRYNGVYVLDTDKVSYADYKCERCGKITKCIVKGNSIKRIKIESEVDSNADITKLYSNMGASVIFAVTIIFFTWQPFLNLIPTFIFHESEWPTLCIFISLLYLLLVVLFLFCKMTPLSLLFLLLLSLQWTKQYSSDTLYTFIEQQSYIINGSITLVIAGLTIPFFSKMNKLARALFFGFIGWVAMYTLFKVAFPTFVDMDYSYTFTNYLIRFICVSIMTLPMLIALLYMASNFGSFKPFLQAFFSVGAICMCELLPLPYTMSLYLRITMMIVYLYTALKISGFVSSWAKSDISRMRFDNALKFSEIWIPKVRVVAMSIACSWLVLFIVSSVLMNLVG